MPDVSLPRVPVLRLVAAAASLPTAAVGLAIATASTAITLSSAAPASPTASATFATRAAARKSASGQLWSGKRGVSRLGRVRSLLQVVPVPPRLVHGVRHHRVCLGRRTHRRH